jgi:hypothetical protein
MFLLILRGCDDQKDRTSLHRRRRCCQWQRHSQGLAQRGMAFQYRRRDLVGDGKKLPRGSVVLEQPQKGTKKADMLQAVSISQFKDRAADGKNRLTDFCKIKSVVFLINSLPTLKYAELIELLSNIEEFEKTLLSTKVFEYRSVTGLIYLVGAGNNLYKIGITTTDIVYRFKRLQDCSPVSLSLEAVWEVYDFRKIEVLLHEKFKDKRSHGEWFNLNEDDIQAIYAFMQQ